jgi:hypothetical protein
MPTPRYGVGAVARRARHMLRAIAAALLGVFLFGAGYVLGHVESRRDASAKLNSRQTIAVAKDVHTVDRNEPVPTTDGQRDGRLKTSWMALVSLALAGFIVWRVVRRRRGSPADGVKPDMPKNRAKRLKRSAERAKADDKLSPARYDAMRNPFGASFAHLSLEERFAQAAQASKETSNGIGLVYVSVPRRDDGAASWSDMKHRMEAAIASAKPGLQSLLVAESDHIAVIVSRLKNLPELREIADTLVGAIGRRQGETHYPGLAIYPLHGYTARDLTEHARQDSLVDRI